jgi:hypothetical protein
VPAQAVGIPGLDLEPGDHVCGLYNGVAGRDGILMPFLRAGLDAGDICLCVTHATGTADVADKLRELMDGVDACLESAQLTVEPSTETYLRGGAFSKDAMLDFYETFVTGATNAGSLARIAGEGAWAFEGTPPTEALIEYESDLNRFVIRYPQIILCLYDLTMFGGAFLVDLMKTHKKLMLGGLVLENPHYLSPDEFQASRN